MRLLPGATVRLAPGTAAVPCGGKPGRRGTGPNRDTHVRAYRFYPWRRSGFPRGRGGGVPVSGGFPVQEASGARGCGAQQGSRCSPPCPALGLLVLPFLPVPSCPHAVPSRVAPPQPLCRGSRDVDGQQLSLKTRRLTNCAESSGYFMSSSSHFS